MGAAKRGYEGRASFGSARVLKVDGPLGARGTVLVPVVSGEKKAAPERPKPVSGRRSPVR